MNRTERIKAANERLREAIAEQHNRAEKRKARDAAAKKAEAQLARLGKALVVYKATGEAAPEAASRGLAGFGVGYGTGALTDEKAVLQGLLSGGLRVSLTGSITLAPSTAVTRVRFPEPAHVKSIREAQRAQERAQARLDAAKKVVADRVAAAFEATPKPDPKALFSGIAQVVAAKHAIPYRGAIDNDRWEIERDQRAVTEAQLHLAATRKGQECECEACKRQRAKEAGDAEQRAKNIAYLAAMPRRKVKCPDHGLVLMPWTRDERNLSPERATELGFSTWGVHRVPIAYCTKSSKADGPYPYHTTLLLTDTLKADQEAAAKMAAKAAKEAAKAKAKVKPVEGNLIEGMAIAFVCPSCGDTTRYAEVYSDDDGAGELFVDCGSCGAELLASGVNRVKSEGRKAA